MTQSDQNDIATLDIQIVADVVCPWCVIGSRHLLLALEDLRDELRADITWQPFQLNPHIAAEGENLSEHIMRKYGSGPEDNQAMRDRLTEMGRAAGFRFNFTPESRTYNSFDAHRAIHWAGVQGRQHDFVEQLFQAYFTENRNPSALETLTDAAVALGLDTAELEAVINGDQYRQEVEQALAASQARGISGVPTFIINQKYAMTGGQPVDVFKRTLRQVVKE
ncbi:DsbA family oxidoreductase [Natronospirillum operosum]|uniref:DsbA family oxidoreductase n=1 Tax=Natronospirillum operosum TaxID=2759953 RepID=A0A4Z0WGL0_9GAMM|nr:DsbA family oxidoreductase [Natronospirillum operosum]TGG94866.1 DsbA family oxidoreductase [Natronospirillum operosum]